MTNTPTPTHDYFYGGQWWPVDDTPGKTETPTVQGNCTATGAATDMGPALDPSPKVSSAPALTKSTEFDMRHLHNCPQAAFRPGDRCSCNKLFAVEHYYPHETETSARSDKCYAEIHAEIIAARHDASRIDLDWE